MATYHPFNSLRKLVKAPVNILIHNVHCTDENDTTRQRVLLTLMDSCWENHPDHGQSDS